MIAVSDEYNLISSQLTIHGHNIIDNNNVIIQAIVLYTLAMPMNICSPEPCEIWVYGFGGLERWNGMMEWTGMEWPDAIL